MRKLVIAFLILMALGLAAPTALAGPILFEAAFSQNGALSAPGLEPANWNLAGFDTVTGLGTITAQATGAGLYSILVFLDIEMDEETNTFFNEFGTVIGAPDAGLSWEIDEPGYGGIFGDIYDNFVAGTLDGTNALAGPPYDDVSMALGRAFNLDADEVATLTFRSSLTAPADGFYLVHSDPDSNLSVYFSSDLTIRGGGTPVPDAGSTLLLLGLGLAACARGLRRRV
jgi:hypothetical protein